MNRRSGKSVMVTGAGSVVGLDRDIEHLAFEEGPTSSPDLWLGTAAIEVLPTGRVFGGSTIARPS
jgi:hypothetical protein